MPAALNSAFNTLFKNRVRERGSVFFLKPKIRHSEFRPRHEAAR